MVRLEVLSPVGSPAPWKPTPSAPRLANPDGMTFGLFWNGKHGGDIALERTRLLLNRRYPQAQFKLYAGSVGAGQARAASDKDIADIAQECQAVIGATAD